MADKALMTTLVGCLAYNGALPLPIAALILGRDVSLAVAAIYYRYASLPAPKTMSRYWDFSLPSAEVHPTTVSKYNTFLQLILIGTTMCVQLLHDPSALNSGAGAYLQAMQAGLGGPEGVDMLVKSMSGVVAATTTWSGLSYAWMRNAVTILGDNEELKRKQGFRGRMIIGGCFGSVVVAAGYLAWKDWNKEEENGEKTLVTRTS
jgi:cardiolipin synthase